MKPFETKGYTQYGASMGRRSDYNNLAGKVHLVRVKLDSGGYDKGGAYWGSGVSLWCAWNDDATVYLRAHSRQAAKQSLIESAADTVTFYR